MAAPSSHPLAHTPVDLTFWINKAKANAAGKLPVSLRITIFGKRAEVSTKIRCLPEQWDKASKRLIPKSKNDAATLALNIVLDDLEAKARLVASDVRRNATEQSPYTAAAVRDALVPPPPAPVPCALVLLEQARLSYPNFFTQATFSTPLQLLRRYAAPAERLPLPSLTPDYCRAFGAWLATQDVGRAAPRYLDSLRALYSRANPAQPNPFSIKTPRGKVRVAKPRYVLSKEEIASLARTDLPTPGAKLARDVYLTQYYLHGSRVGVVLELAWQQVDWDRSRVRFKAEKGGDWHDVALRPALAVVLRPYWPGPGAEGPVFPLLPKDFATRSDREKWKLRKAANTRVWNGLQIVARVLNLPGHLHSHTARHSLATHTVEATGSFRLAQDFLGHSSLAMTEKYVRSMLPRERDEGADLVYGS